RLLQLLHQVGERRRADGFLLRQLIYRFRRHVEDHALVATLDQAAHHIRAHSSETDHAELHVCSSLRRGVFEFRLLSASCRPSPASSQALFLTTSLFDAMTASSSFQDFTNDLAPSSWSWMARAWTSTPTLANSASTSSQSPPSAGRIEPSSLCKASAFKVASGMVFTVNGAASPLTYRMSDADGSLVPVLAHSRRCGRAPAL